jgi:hypothetical protein
MCAGRAEAHDAVMFNSYEMTRAFVAERQQTLRHEARQHDLGRGRRRHGGGRRGSGARGARPAVPTVRPAPRRVAAAVIAGDAEEQLAA